MLKITLLALGRLKEPWLREAAKEYEKRLSGLCKFQCVELDPVRLPDRPSDAQIADALEKEGQMLLSRLPVGAAAVPLCIEGETCSSEALAGWMQQTALTGRGHLSFIIGSSYGLADSVKTAGLRRLSLSPMTFPHQLTRILLMEQLYRACSILSGGAYHK